jgi:EAL domain-containing protein (putative c-di-GMP-specific phosphodiesterase class I)
MRRLGVTHGQGYLFAHPLPAAALKAFLNQPAR